MELGQTTWPEAVTSGYRLQRAVLRSMVLQCPCSNDERQEITGMQSSGSGEQATNVEVISVKKTVLPPLTFLKPCAELFLFPHSVSPLFYLPRTGGALSSLSLRALGSSEKEL